MRLLIEYIHAILCEEATELSFLQRANNVMQAHGDAKTLYHINSVDDFISRVKQGLTDALTLSHELRDAYTARSVRAMSGELTGVPRLLNGADALLKELELDGALNLFLNSANMNAYIRSKWNIYFIVAIYIVPAAKLVDKALLSEVSIVCDQ